MMRRIRAGGARRPVGTMLVAVAVAALVPADGIAQQRSRADLFRELLAFRAEDLEGRLWTHERLQGRIVLVDFWATWCAPCLEELPFLKRARQRYGEDFEVLGISLDSSDRRSLIGWLRRQGVDWPQIHQHRGYDDRIPVAFGVDRLPTNLLLDRGGRLRALNVRGERLFVEIDRLRQEERAAGRPDPQR